MKITLKVNRPLRESRMVESSQSSYRAYDLQETNALIGHIQSHMPWLEVVSILDVGSRSKGEANDLSDYDFQIVAQSRDAILEDASNINSDIAFLRAHLIDNQVSTLLGLPLRQIDPQQVEQLIKEWQEYHSTPVGLVFIDFRTHFFDLAFETPMSVYRVNWFLMTSNIVYDKYGVMPYLRRRLISRRCFHWQTTIALQVARYLRYDKLRRIEDELSERLQVAGDINQSAYKWVVWALNYVRFAVGTAELAQTGNYMFMRNDIVRYVAKELSSVDGAYVSQLYRYKCDPALRPKIHEIILGPSRINDGAISNSTRKISDLLRQVADITEQLRPPREKDRRYEIAEYIMHVSAQWLRLPRIPYDTFLDASKQMTLTVLEMSYGN